MEYKRNKKFDLILNIILILLSITLTIFVKEFNNKSFEEKNIECEIKCINEGYYNGSYEGGRSCLCKNNNLYNNNFIYYYNNSYIENDIIK